MKKLLVCLLLMLAQLPMTKAATQGVVAEEGAWCWFADPRAVHYENAAKTINATYIGYIDVHGNVKATQYDWLSGRKTDVLVRSCFQPDDHNNPTFLVLPDERVMIFYTRHTDEPCIWYRISAKPGDIASLGEEKRLATEQNTTYPSPFIMSDDPQHIYLCWRGINWHPTIARLTMPDANDDCRFDFGPKQIVQSTGARPYAKYHSNGKDKIYVSYTTGHPDNEQPNWLYFNVIDINKGNGPILRDLNGKQLSVVQNGAFNVNKSDSYASQYPATVVDKTTNIRNWVWQIALDKEEHPVVAYTHIDDAKTTHVYWYARWTGSAWRNTWVQYAGHAFHQNWNSTEKCYTGGMAIDPEHINDLYLSIPTTNGAYNKDGVHEIWKYTIDDEGKVSGSEQLTANSPKNNARPYIIPGTLESSMRLIWMQGDYYYWIVKQGFPQGFPTAIHCDYEWKEETTKEPDGTDHLPYLALGANKSITIGFAMNTNKYEGKLLTVDGPQPLTYSLNGNDQYPVITLGNKTYKSQNRLLTSDDWATMSTGTSGDNHPTKLSTWVLTLTYDGKTLTIYRNGLVDQAIEVEGILGEVNLYAEKDADGKDVPFNHKPVSISNDYVCHSPITVQQKVKEAQADIEKELDAAALETLSIPSETRTDMVLPAQSLGQNVSWTSSNEQVISSSGVLFSVKNDTEVTLTAQCGTHQRTFQVKALARDIKKNLLYEKNSLDLSGNTATGFSSNKYEVAPQGLLEGLRSFTALVTIQAKSLDKQPRIYDFGSGSGNSLFLRANPLAAGVKYNGGTTTMVNGKTQLGTGKDIQLAVSYDASTRTTRIYIGGEEDASGTVNQYEGYQLYQIAADTRNYIGRTQWWDSSYAADNADFQGIISDFKLYNTALSREEICLQQDIEYHQKELPSELKNGDFEGNYAPMPNSGVVSDRAIYLPEGWNIDYTSPNENDLTALKSGDLYFERFFGALQSPSADSKQTYWIRQNWGNSTITLSQELRLPEGKYTLTADVWNGGKGGNASVVLAKEGGNGTLSSTLNAANSWQKASIEFECDGKEAITIQLKSAHQDNGTEQIAGFDNVIITPHPTNGISNVSYHATRNRAFDLQGRAVSTQSAPKGIIILNGKKVVK